MGRLFLWIYIMAVITLLIIDWGANTLVEKAVGESHYYAYYRNLSKGTLFLLCQQFEGLPESEWQNHIKTLEPSFSYPIKIEKYTEMDLTRDETGSILKGNIVIRQNYELFHQRIGNSSYVITTGPVPDMELPAKVNWISFICVYTAFAVAVLLWVWPVWRHLNQLGQTADAFGNGNFNARANVPSRSAIASLSKTFNSMADRIQRLIASHKELTNAVSHELRTPISRLRFGADMLQTAHEDSLRQQHLSGMNDDIDELESLVREMLTYSRFDRDTPDMKPEQQQIYSWLKHIVAEKQKMSDSVQLICRINSPENLYAEYEPRLMARAIDNLLTNALRYAREEVNITAGTQGTECVIHIDDDGPGIPAEGRERIFEPFVRLDTSRDRKSGGYGLGLAIVRRIMQWHNGSVDTGSSLAGGARFTLRWPGCTN